MKAKSEMTVVDINAVKSRMLIIRGQQVLLDRDVATLYGVMTKEVNQAVRNNPEKFPDGYVIKLGEDELSDLRSKFLTANLSVKSRVPPTVFTEQGLYMLATILKGAVATKATLAIIETYVQVRGLKRELAEMHKESNVRKRSAMMRHFGEALADIVMPDLDAVETESSLELNFFIGKIKHTVRRVKRAGDK